MCDLANHHRTTAALHPLFPLHKIPTKAPDQTLEFSLFPSFLRRCSLCSPTLSNLWFPSPPRETARDAFVTPVDMDATELLERARRSQSHQHLLLRRRESGAVDAGNGARTWSTPELLCTSPSPSPYSSQGSSPPSPSTSRTPGICFFSDRITKWCCEIRQVLLQLFIGYPYGLPLGPAMGSTLSGGAAGCHGFWMHTAPDGRSGYLVPGWLATY